MALVMVFSVFGLAACGSSGSPFVGGDGSGGSTGDGTGNGGSAANNGGGGLVVNDAGNGSGGDTAGGGGGTAGGGGDVDCDNPKLTTVVRDFRACSGAQWEGGYVASCSSGHPDFETFGGDLSPEPACCGGMVEATLTNGKPVQRVPGPHMDGQWGQQTASAASFAQWYEDVDGVNSRVDTFVTLSPKTGADAYGCTSAASCFVYDSEENQPAGFFPIDGQGFADEAEDEDGVLHNFAFTTEIHTKFEYKGGEVFTFSGDDDVWVFINGRIAIDLGGLHPRREGSVSLDADADKLGIAVGGTYKLEIFHAERHTEASNFRIETTIECIQDVPLPK